MFNLEILLSTVQGSCILGNVSSTPNPLSLEVLVRLSLLGEFNGDLQMTLDTLNISQRLVHHSATQLSDGKCPSIAYFPIVLGKCTP